MSCGARIPPTRAQKAQAPIHTFLMTVGYSSHENRKIILKQPAMPKRPSMARAVETRRKSVPEAKKRENQASINDIYI